MNRISLRNITPNIFSDAGDLSSGIWNKEIYFEKGKSYLIEAASGKGKSSLCSFIYGYRNDYQGSIFFDDKNINIFNSSNWDIIRSSKISLLFQELNLFPELTAFENVLLKNNLTNYKKRHEIEEMFDYLGIIDKKDKKIAKMSWGQQQRVAVIRCLCQPFDFILLDEPISHLDDENASNVAGLIESEVSVRNAGLIVTSIGKNLPVSYTSIIAL